MPATFLPPVIRACTLCINCQKDCSNYRGEFGYYRTVLADSIKIGPGDLLAAGEFNAYDGVWQQPEDLGKYNGMLRYTLDNNDWGLSVNAEGLSLQLECYQPDS